MRRRGRGKDMDMRPDGVDEEKAALLIVDDNEINRMILCETFKGRDEILEAENGEEALALIRRNPGSISAVLLDIVMPKMDGQALLEILNREGLTETIPVFLVTADTSEQNISGDISWERWTLLKSRLFRTL